MPAKLIEPAIKDKFQAVVTDERFPDVARITCLGKKLKTGEKCTKAWEAVLVPSGLDSKGEPQLCIPTATLTTLMQHWKTHDPTYRPAIKAVS